MPDANPESNDVALLVALPGASLAALSSSRAPVLAAEVARLDKLVSEQAQASLDPFDAPGDFRTALAALA